MRWGYDGGGVACGPVDGINAVEICVTGDDNHNYFVMDSKFCDSHRIDISEMPMFDLLIESNYSYIDVEYELDKLNKVSFEKYEFFDDDDMPEEIYNSKFKKVIDILVEAVNFYCSSSRPENLTAAEYIERYIDETL